MNKKITAIAVLALWGLLTAGAWFLPSKEMSEAERRPLAQFPPSPAKNYFFAPSFANHLKVRGHTQPAKRTVMK